MQNIEHQINTPELVSKDTLKLTHDKAYIEFLTSIKKEFPDKFDETAPIGFKYPFGRFDDTIDFHGKLGKYLFDPSTPITRNVFQASVASASSAYAAAKRLSKNNPTISLSRPPGHHAMYGVGGGYCFINNAAVAANHFRSKKQSVSILDLDFHHGNGTQEIFYSTDEIQYTSLHGTPETCYPYYWGGEAETGEGEGIGFNYNFPLTLQTGDEVYLEKLREGLNNIDNYDPQVLIISLGLDAYYKDPVGGMQLSLGCYRKMAESINSRSYNKIEVVLEGGYSKDTGKCFANFILGLI